MAIVHEVNGTWQLSMRLMRHANGDKATVHEVNPFIFISSFS
jgi:hypothetical protein